MLPNPMKGCIKLFPGARALQVTFVGRGVLKCIAGGFGSNLTWRDYEAQNGHN